MSNKAAIAPDDSDHKHKVPTPLISRGTIPEMWNNVAGDLAVSTVIDRNDQIPIINGNGEVTMSSGTYIPFSHDLC